MLLRRLVQIALPFAAVLPALPADAAEITEVVDAFDTANDNPFDFHVEPTFRQTHERATIAREAGCSDCDEAILEFRRELAYKRVTTALDFDFQFGLQRDLEFHVTLPVVISDRRSLEYADGVTEDNSNVDPSDERVRDDLDPSVQDFYDGTATQDDRRHFGTYRYFSVPDDGVRRSGLGDMKIGLAWAPFNDERQGHAATLLLGIDYVAPTGRPAEGDNTGVGRGVHELQLRIAASRRLRDFVEPYFSFSYAQPFAGSAGLFADDSPNSETRAPGGRLDLGAGTEIVLYEDPRTDQHYSWDLGFTFGYTLEGRDYNPMSDALSRSACNGLTAEAAGFGVESGADEGGTDGNAYNPTFGEVSDEDAACAWVVQQPGNVTDDSGVREDWAYAHDGITDIEGHGRIGGRTGFNLQFSPYVELRIGVGLEWINPHMMTAADSGRDTDGDDIVELDPAPADGDVERNPFYNLTLDAVGRRFRIENALHINWDLALAFQF